MLDQKEWEQSPTAVGPPTDKAFSLRVRTRPFYQFSAPPIAGSQASEDVEFIVWNCNSRHEAAEKLREFLTLWSIVGDVKGGAA